MATQTRTWTYADLEAMPEAEHERYEIIEGELVVTPSPVPYHQLVLTPLFRAFDRAAVASDAGIVLTASVDVRFAPRAVAVPDLLFIARGRRHIIGPTAIEGAPDLVLEILSPSTRGRDLGKKMALYARYGVREYWVVDPEARSITVYLLRGDRYEPLPQEGGLARSTVIPGLEIDVAALFAAADI